MSLLPFPAEIRMNIYCELLICNAPLILDPVRPNESVHLFGVFDLCPALLGVSRHTRAEAAHLLYARNRFKFASVADAGGSHPEVAPFLQQVGAANARLMTHACVEASYVLDRKGCRAALPARSVDALGSIQAACPRLRVLEVWCVNAEVRMPLDDHGNSKEVVRAVHDAVWRTMRGAKRLVLVAGTEGAKDTERMLERNRSLLGKMRDKRWDVASMPRVRMFYL